MCRLFGLALLLILVHPVVAGADPAPTSVCQVQLGTLFCFRSDDIEIDPADADRVSVELMFVNWTATDAAGLVLSLNYGPDGDGPASPGSPVVVDAWIDTDGRPIGAGGTPPAGNLPTNNDWSVVSLTASRAIFLGGTPIPHRTHMGTSNGVPNTYHGLLDPDFASPTLLTECIDALTSMIPGTSNMGGNPPLISAADPEVIDNADNVLDGFVIVIDDWGPGEQVSLNWHLTDTAGNAVGIVDTTGAVLGDAFGFGLINMARPSSPMPPPLFVGNTGYDPPDTNDPNVDSPLFWAEDEVAGIDTSPVNPVPSGEAGAGSYFGIEFAAALTAPFRNSADATGFQFDGQPIDSGTNTELAPFCGDAACNGTETCETCPQDCGACPPVCGDESCNGAETCKTCSQDCGVCPPVCGDETCNGAETCVTCPQDCGACPPVCGDESCNGAETCTTCPQDCGACPPVCGDGSCNGTETCADCSADCCGGKVPTFGYTRVVLVWLIGSAAVILIRRFAA